MNIDLLLKVISTISTFGIGVLLAFIAFQQFRISRAKLKFDLYEKRLKVFNLVTKFIGSIVADGNIELNALHQFLYETNECEFLFRKDVCEYIQLLYRKGKELHYANKKLESRILSESDRNKATDKDLEIGEWFFQQLTDVRKAFSKDLAIKSLR